MVGRIFLYRFRSEAGGDHKGANLKWASEVFAKLQKEFPTLVKVETGVNFCHFDYSSDFVVNLDFNSWEASENFLELEKAKEAFDFADRVCYEKKVISYIF